MATRARYAKSFAQAIFACIVLASVQAQPKTGSSSISIQIQAVVPQILTMSLDFSPDASTRVRGWLSSQEERADTPSASNRSESRDFRIREGAVVELGGIHLFSNTNAPASIQIYSANGGCLLPDSTERPMPIPYSLIVGEQRTLGSAGSFSVRSPGKTPMEGTDLRVALAIASVPRVASSGWYSDTLTFQVAAN